jgi:hypothetical protein
VDIGGGFLGLVLAGTVPTIDQEVVKVNDRDSVHHDRRSRVTGCQTGIQAPGRCGSPTAWLRVERFSRRKGLQSCMGLLRKLALAWAVAAMGAGVWLAYRAWQLGSQGHGMMAIVLLLSAPMLAAAVILGLPDQRADDELTSAGTYSDAIDRIDLSLRIVRFCRAHLGVAGSFAGVLWFCQLTGYMRLLEFLLFYTLACAVAAAVCLPWLASGERRLCDARAEYRRRLGLIDDLLQEPASARRDVY